jgi:hypothetical protein
MAESLNVIADLGVEDGVVVGYYDGRRRRQGEGFSLKARSDFSHRWMRAVDWDPGEPPSNLLRTKPGVETAAAITETQSFKEKPNGDVEPAPVEVPERRSRRSRASG